MTNGKHAIAIAGIQADMIHVKKTLDDIKNSLENNLVHKHEFEPVKKATYAAIGLLCTIVLSAIFYMVIK